MRAAPTFWLQTLTVCMFSAGVAIKSGILVMLGWLAVGLALLVILGYPLFRRRGRIG